MKKSELKKIIIPILLVITLIVIVVIYIYSNKIAANRHVQVRIEEPLEKPGEPGEPSKGDSEVSYSAKTEITTDTTIAEETTYESTTANENALAIKGNGITANLSNIKVKKSGNSDGGDNSNFYGNNSAILVRGGATAIIENATISADAKGANGVFCYGGNGGRNGASGDGTTLNISNSEISTTGNNGGGIMTTGGGITNITNCTVNTLGDSSAAIRTDRGGGTVTVTDGTYNTAGHGSPIVYVTAEISAKGIKGEATESQCVVVEGKNNITLDNCELTSSGRGNRTSKSTNNLVDSCGVMLYQSMSGDSETGTSSFTATKSSLAISQSSEYYYQAPMFFVTNTNAIINLTDTNLSFGSNVILNAASTDQWGNSGSNGGNVVLNAKSQKLEGNINCDSSSSVTLKLSEASSLKGAINSEAQGNVSIILEDSSKWEVTEDSYISGLSITASDYSQIVSNGKTIYYDSTNNENDYLNKETINLPDGGILKPYK